MNNIILENEGLGYIYVDLVRKHVSYSENFCNTLGYKVEEISDSTDDWLDIVHPDDISLIEETFNEHIVSKGKVPFKNEIRYISKDGKSIWHLITANIIEWTEDGTAAKIECILFNIQKKKQKEKATSEINNELLNDITTINQKQKVFNERLLKLLEINNKQFESFESNLNAYVEYGIKVLEFENGIISFIEGDDYKIFKANTKQHKLQKGDTFQLCDTICKEVYDNKTTIFYSTLKGKEQYELLARKQLDVESFLGTPIFIDGRIFGTLTFYSTKEKNNTLVENEITIIELISSQIAKLIQNYEYKIKLEDERNLLRLGEEFLQMATYKRYIEEDRVEFSENCLKLFGLTEKDGVVQDNALEVAFEHIHPEDRKKAFKLVEDSRNPEIKRIKPQEYRITQPNGITRWFRHKIIKFDDNPFIYGVIRDITYDKKIQLDHKRQANKLQVNNRELEQFNYVTAHDLKQPLRTISGFGKKLKEIEAENLSEKGNQFIGLMVDAADRMTKQIDGILTHSRIGQQTNKESFDLQEIIDIVKLDLQQQIEESSAVIVIDSLPKMYAYKTEIKLLFQNLLSNAIKYRKDNEPVEIHINFQEDKEFWYFSVSDNGIGIPDDKKSKIFDLFVTLHPRSKYDSIGIGLSHCRKIVYLHQGNIRAVNNMRGGTTFKFSIIKELI